MRAKLLIENIIKGLIAVIIVVCILGGIILMMLESSDPITQTRTTIIGAVLFIVGIAPGALISAITTRKEGKKNGLYDRRNGADED